MLIMNGLHIMQVVKFYYELNIYIDFLGANTEIHLTLKHILNTKHVTIHIIPPLIAIPNHQYNICIN